MKEHAKYKSTKPLLSKVPGEISTGDLMFVETKDDKKKPLLLDVDVATKMITAVSMPNKTSEECTAALLQVKAEYAIHGRVMLKQVFDRESGIIHLDEKMKADGIQLKFTAAGQKVVLHRRRDILN